MRKSKDDWWMEQAKCAQLSQSAIDQLFWPPERKGYRRDFTRAKAICEACPVRVHCYMFAVAHKIPYGVWGGRTEAERSHIAKPTKLALRRAWYSGLIPDLWEGVMKVG